MPLRAEDLRLFCFRQCPGPKFWAGPVARVAVAIHKAAVEKIHQPGVQRFDAQRVLRRQNRISRRGDIGIGALGDANFKRRRIACRKPLRPERMAAFHQQLKNQHAQAKSIVIRFAQHIR